MARTTTIHREIRAQLMGARAPVSATDLAALLRVNRTTIVRSLPALGADLLTSGATRSTRYLLRRVVRNIGSQWPMYRLDEAGQAREWGQLLAVHERGWMIDWQGAEPEWASIFTQPNGLWSGFPFFLNEVRPQGFLGRLIVARTSRMLALPDDLRHWSDDDVLVFLEMAGDNLPGNIVVGEASLRQAMASGIAGSDAQVIHEENRIMEYPRAAREIALSAPGSSAGGEQPKFLTQWQRCDGSHEAVLVKFTAPMDQELGRRWADLLACEFHAHEVLASVGLATHGACLLDAGGRRFLQVPRFDRVGRAGRRGVVSLESLTTAIAGLPRDWNDGAEILTRSNLLDAAGRLLVQRLHAFGELIGNSDMHAGNLAFFLEDAMALRVTPSFDMLPMLWAPGNQGEIIERTFSPAPPLPSHREAWNEAANWAADFWQRVMNDSRISADFRTQGERALSTLLRLRERV